MPQAQQDIWLFGSDSLTLSSWVYKRSLLPLPMISNSSSYTFFHFHPSRASLTPCRAARLQALQLSGFLVCCRLIIPVAIAYQTIAAGRDTPVWSRRRHSRLPRGASLASSLSCSCSPTLARPLLALGGGGPICTTRLQSYKVRSSTLQSNPFPYTRVHAGSQMCVRPPSGSVIPLSDEDISKGNGLAHMVSTFSGFQVGSCRYCEARCCSGVASDRFEKCPAPCLPCLPWNSLSSTLEIRGSSDTASRKLFSRHNGADERDVTAQDLQGPQVLYQKPITPLQTCHYLPESTTNTQSLCITPVT